MLFRGLLGSTQSDPDGRCTEHQRKNNHDQHQRNALPVNRWTVSLVLLVSHREAQMELRATVSC